ncbi:MAG: YdjY domain-containing protein [Planctomycetota bacterium]
MFSGCCLIVITAALYGMPVDVVPGSEPSSSGSIQLGKVRYLSSSRSVEADGYFNLVSGFVEYLVCTPGTKPHETLVALDCDPADLQTALLMLGIEQARSPETEMDLGPLSGGDRVIISLRFRVQDPEGRERLRTIRAERCIINAPMAREMSRCGFAFTASGFLMLDAPPGAPEGTVAAEEFMARVTGEVISLCHRPWAILDNPLALPYPDGDYFAYAEVLPKHRRDDPPAVTVLFRRAVAADVDSSAIRMELPAREKESEADSDGTDGAREG